MTYPKAVRLVDVGPRDGLQNERNPVPTAAKIALIDGLADAGLKSIEAASFVSPKWVPQMADGAAVMAGLSRRAGVVYSALTPNATGLDRALKAGVDEVAVFAAVTEAFSQKNINCSIAESLERFHPVMDGAKQAGIPVRGYLSCVLGCPYEGDVDRAQVAAVARDLAAMGCYEISLGDTIGVGTPKKAAKLVEWVAKDISLDHLAVHFHDTYGQALANILAALDVGVTVIDSAVAGLGGCPYAKGATGNVATEDVVYMLDGMNIETGVDIGRLVAVAWTISDAITRTPVSRVAHALGRPNNKRGAPEA